jgi:hypothetical protein
MINNKPVIVHTNPGNVTIIEDSMVYEDNKENTENKEDNEDND